MCSWWVNPPEVSTSAPLKPSTRLLELRAQGKAILLVSVELDEIRALADRVLVMYDGQIMGETRPDASDAEMGQLMAGVIPA